MGSFSPLHVVVKGIRKSPRRVNQVFFHAVDVFLLHIMFLHFQRAFIKAADVVQHVPEGGGDPGRAPEAGVKLGEYPGIAQSRAADHQARGLRQPHPGVRRGGVHNVAVGDDGAIQDFHGPFHPFRMDGGAVAFPHGAGVDAHPVRRVRGNHGKDAFKLIRSLVPQAAFDGKGPGGQGVPEGSQGRVHILQGAQHASPRVPSAYQGGGAAHVQVHSGAGVFHQVQRVPGQVLRLMAYELPVNGAFRGIFINGAQDVWRHLFMVGHRSEILRDEVIRQGIQVLQRLEESQIRHIFHGGQRQQHGPVHTVKSP